MSQKSRPVSDEYPGAWEPVPLWDRLDPVAPDDQEYIRSPELPPDQSFVVALAPLAGPVAGRPEDRARPHALVVRLDSTSCASAVLALLEPDGDEDRWIASRRVCLTPEFQDYPLTLSYREAAAIGSYADLRVLVLASADGSSCSCPSSRSNSATSASRSSTTSNSNSNSASNTSTGSRSDSASTSNSATSTSTSTSGISANSTSSTSTTSASSTSNSSTSNSNSGSSTSSTSTSGSSTSSTSSTGTSGSGSRSNSSGGSQSTSGSASTSTATSNNSKSTAPTGSCSISGTFHLTMPTGCGIPNFSQISLTNGAGSVGATTICGTLNPELIPPQKGWQFNIRCEGGRYYGRVGNSDLVDEHEIFPTFNPFFVQFIYTPRAEDCCSGGSVTITIYE